MNHLIDGKSGNQTGYNLANDSENMLGVMVFREIKVRQSLEKSSS